MITANQHLGYFYTIKTCSTERKKSHNGLPQIVRRREQKQEVNIKHRWWKKNCSRYVIQLPKRETNKFIVSNDEAENVRAIVKCTCVLLNIEDGRQQKKKKHTRKIRLMFELTTDKSERERNEQKKAPYSLLYRQCVTIFRSLLVMQTHIFFCSFRTL